MRTTTRNVGCVVLGRRTLVLLVLLLSAGGPSSGIAEARSSSSSSSPGGGATKGGGLWGWGRIGRGAAAKRSSSSPFQPSSWSVAPRTTTTSSSQLPLPGTCHGGICRPRVDVAAAAAAVSPVSHPPKHPPRKPEEEVESVKTTTAPAVSSDLRGGATRTTTPDSGSEGGGEGPPLPPVESTAAPEASAPAVEAPEGTKVAGAAAATTTAAVPTLAPAAEASPGADETSGGSGDGGADRPEEEGELSSNHPQTIHPHNPETRAEKRRRLKRHKLIAKQLKNRNARNLRRKVMHACFGLTFACLNHWLPKTTFVPAMATLSSATLLMELLRYRKGFGWMNAVLHGILGQSLRKHEMEGKFTGSFYFFTGVTLTSWWFDSTAATLGICQLALADPSASYFGRKTRHIYWSRIENGFGGFGRNKGVLGFLGGALFCFPFNYRVLTVAARRAALAATTTTAASGAALPFSPVPSTTLAVASLLLGLAGALADLAVPTPAVVLPKRVLGLRVPPFHVDDNTVVPLFSAYACQQIFGVLKLSHLSLSPWLVV